MGARNGLAIFLPLLHRLICYPKSSRAKHQAITLGMFFNLQNQGR